MVTWLATARSAPLARLGLVPETRKYIFEAKTFYAAVEKARAWHMELMVQTYTGCPWYMLELVQVPEHSEPIKFSGTW